MLSEVTDRLLDEGVASFRASFEQLLAAVEKKRTTPARASVALIILMVFVEALMC